MSFLLVYLVAFFITHSAYGADIDFDRAVIGVSVMDVPEDRVFELHAGPLKFRSKGALVYELFTASPAGDADMEPVDLIEGVGDVRVTNSKAFIEAMKATVPGRPVTLRIRKPIWAKSKKTGKQVGKYKSRPERIEVTPSTYGELLRRQMVADFHPESEVTRYAHASFEGIDSTTGFDVLFNEAEGIIVPMLHIHYRAADWMFWHTAHVVVGGKTFVFEHGGSGVSREVKRGGIREWTATTTLGLADLLIHTAMTVKSCYSLCMDCTVFVVEA